jgi:hypothetical protein
MTDRRLLSSLLSAAVVAATADTPTRPAVTIRTIRSRHRSKADQRRRRKRQQQAESRKRNRGR